MSSATRRDPVQRRSRRRVEQILAAAEHLVAAQEVDELTTRAVAELSGVPVPTVYRYFANADAILIALLEREIEMLDARVAEEVLSVERVSLRSLLETAVMTRVRHHQRRPFSVVLWYGGYGGPAVRARVEQRNEQLARWLETTFRAAGLIREDTPDYGAVMLTALADRMYEFTLLSDRPAAEQESMARNFIEMVVTYIERFAEPSGIEGIPLADFLALLAENAEQPAAGPGILK